MAEVTTSVMAGCKVVGVRVKRACRGRFVGLRKAGTNGRQSSYAVPVPMFRWNVWSRARSREGGVAEKWTLPWMGATRGVEESGAGVNCKAWCSVGAVATSATRGMAVVRAIAESHESFAAPTVRSLGGGSRADMRQYLAAPYVDRGMCSAIYCWLDEGAVREARHGVCGRRRGQSRCGG